MTPRRFKSTLLSESVCLLYYTQQHITHAALPTRNTVSTCMCHLVIPNATQQGAEQGGTQ
jgi:hypothetical protein